MSRWLTHAATNFVFDCEDDLRSAADMAKACYLLMEPGGRIDEARARAVMRCLGHLEDRINRLLAAWNVAFVADQAEQKAATLTPAA